MVCAVSYIVGVVGGCGRVVLTLRYNARWYR